MENLNLISVESLFKDSIFVFDVDIDNTRIKKELDNISLKRLSQDYTHTHFEDFYINDLLNQNTVTGHLLKQINRWGQQRQLELVSTWAHIHLPLESTALHNHAPSHLSFAYYVSLPEGSGKFIFDFSLIQGPLIPVNMKEKMLLIFPSWIPHRVSKNLSKEKRISISGNLDPIK